MKRPKAAGRLLHLFGSSIVDQALLSGANFIVGLILIRHTAEAEYGYYVLAFSAMMLATTLQGTFVGTPFVIRLPTLEPVERRQWAGSLLRDQRRWSLAGAALVLAGAAIAWAAGWMQAKEAYVVPAAVVLVLCSLYREYLRGLQLMLQRPVPVLAADTAYVGILLCGAVVATHFEHSASAALLAAAVASVVGAQLLRRQLHADIDAGAAPGRLRHIASVGAWSAAGAVAYWLFAQGYTFVAAATLDVASVAALAASRLLLMPINLMSAGIQRQIAPVASNWLHHNGIASTLRRLVVLSAVLSLATVAYVAVVWLLRDWIFADLMRRTFAHRDTVILLWAAAFLASVPRDPIMQLLALRQRFRLLLAITLFCAVLALAVSYVGMLHFGIRGAVLGIVVGEWTNLVLVAFFALHEARRENSLTTARD